MFSYANMFNRVYVIQFEWRDGLGEEAGSWSRALAISGYEMMGQLLSRTRRRSTQTLAIVWLCKSGGSVGTFGATEYEYEQHVCKAHESALVQEQTIAAYESQLTSRRARLARWRRHRSRRWAVERVSTKLRASASGRENARHAVLAERWRRSRRSSLRAA